MFNRVIGVVLGLGALVFVLLLAGVGSNALTDDPPAVSPYASDADAVFVVTTVAFDDAGYVEVTNIGTATGSLDGYWLCQFPSYVEIEGTLEPGATARFDGGLGELSDEAGEVGLYTNARFDDPSAIIAYVEWGTTPHGRTATAVEAGVWTAGSVVDTAGAAMIVAIEDAPTSAEGWSSG